MHTILPFTSYCKQLHTDSLSIFAGVQCMDFHFLLLGVIAAICIHSAIRYLTVKICTTNHFLQRYKTSKNGIHQCPSASVQSIYGGVRYGGNFDRFNFELELECLETCTQYRHLLLIMNEIEPKVLLLKKSSMLECFEKYKQSLHIINRYFAVRNLPSPRESVTQF